MTANIKIAYVNQPKSAKGPGSVKSEAGTYYKVWPKTKIKDGAVLADFQVGKSYDVEYDTEDYNGKPQHTIRTASEAVASATSGSGNGSTSNGGAEENRSAKIQRQAALKVAAAMLGPVTGEERVDVAFLSLVALTEKIEAFIDEAGQEQVDGEMPTEEAEVQI